MSRTHFLSVTLLIGIFLMPMRIIYAESVETTPSISASVYKKITAIEALISTADYSAARELLLKLLATVKTDSYEQAISLRSLASVYALENNYAQAIASLKKCLATQQLPQSQQQQALLNLGQLYLAAENYQLAVQVLERWLKVNDTTPKVDVYVLLANANAQIKQYKKALHYIEIAIKQSRQPKQSWLQLNLALCYELKNYRAATKILTTLISRYPNKQSYWQQLAGNYQQLKQFKKALNIHYLAYKKGFVLTETSLLQLINLFLYTQQPYQAAQLLETELTAGRIKTNAQHFELLANAWTHAREYQLAIKALEKASQLHEKGQLYLQLGRIHVEQELWPQAIKALNKALRKGQLKNTGEVYILLGLSYYENGEQQRAEKAFKKAKTFQRSRQSAEQWLSYIADKN